MDIDNEIQPDYKWHTILLGFHTTIRKTTNRFDNIKTMPWPIIWIIRFLVHLHCDTCSPGYHHPKRSRATPPQIVYLI